MQILLTNKKTRVQVQLYAYNHVVWREKFVSAMIKMGEILMKVEMEK